jgi:hypothetical protein
MHREYNEKISCMKQCIQKKNKLTRLLKQTEQDLIKEKLRLNRLLNEYGKENLDVLNLEANNITSLFYTILVSKEEQLKKERQEALKAKLKYDQCRNDVQYLVEESKKLVDELSMLDGCESEYEELIDEKIKVISAEDSETSRKLKKFIKKKESLLAGIKEVDEAIEIGETALQFVEKTILALEIADDWGAWNMSDGKVLSALSKYSNIDEAREYVEETQRYLDKFKREISDLNLITNPVIAFGSFETYADYFFDRLISDWIVQAEIGKSLDIAKNLKNQIDKAMSKLYEEKITEEFIYTQTEDQINTIIENV